MVGGGQCAASLVAKLRSEGFSGEISIFSDEPVPPYQRPPLSKAYLLGEMEEERLYLRPSEYYDQQNIALHLGEPVSSIDATAKTLTVGSNTHSYDHLVLATGASPLRLPADIGGNLKGVYSMRALADIDAIGHEFTPGRSLLVVGGGYIGLEAAAVAAKKGLTVTVVEVANRILSRVAAPETSAYFESLHRSHNVDVRTGVSLRRLKGEDRLEQAVFMNDETLPVDFALVGIGVVPNVQLALDAGVKVDNGIAADQFGRTNFEYIWAAGDCASFPFNGERTRLESVQNAIDQAENVALNILGQNVPYNPMPWFWSDQYDVKLQIAGLNTGYNSVVVRPGERPGAQSQWYYKDGRLISIDAMNDPRAYMVAKRLIENNMNADPGIVGDANANLKDLLNA